MSDLHQDLFEAGGVGKNTVKKPDKDKVIGTEIDLLSFGEVKKPLKLTNKKLDNSEKKQENGEKKTEPVESELKKASMEEKTVKNEEKQAVREIVNEAAPEVKPLVVLAGRKSEKYEKTEVQVMDNASSHVKPIQSRPFTHGEATPGQILQESRVRLNLGLDQVSIRTKVSKQYIEAIERNEFSLLPAPVFTTAYIRALCDCYGIKDREGDILRDFENRQKNKQVPEAILEQIHKGRQVNVDEEKKVTALMTGILVFVLVVIFSGTLSFLYYQYYNKNNGSDVKVFKNVEPPSVPFDPELNKAVSLKIKKNFQYPQFINMTELELEPQKKPEHKE